MTAVFIVHWCEGPFPGDLYEIEGVFSTVEAAMAKFPNVTWEEGVGPDERIGRVHRKKYQRIQETKGEWYITSYEVQS